ncbi:SRPBCC domain-containing protein [uncultured Ruegeria sp.]|uniref:SRPBCC domain-containing protein n=1 Tax=uncultured Ruegeria sp. TaxID=259304 RepID=UPI00260AEA8B|nr:SRPBCC domain-containing protein [uncultured Ruegeria sp.]
MMSKMVPNSESSVPELVFTHLVNAAPDTVYRAWTDPKRLVQWWGPHAFTLSISRMDVRVGGLWEYVLQGPDGTQYPNVAVFEELDPPHRIMFHNSGGHVDDHHLTCRMIVLFTEQAGKTHIRLQMQFETIEALERAASRGAKKGGEQSLQRLASILDVEMSA